MARLNGRVALVTGGAKGIGRHYSQALAAEGARVAIADIADGTDFADEIAAKHGGNSVMSAVFDVSDEAQVKALVAKTIERFGQIDILVNNAALLRAAAAHRSVTDIDVELWDQVMAVNVRGPFLMVKHVAPHMIARSTARSSISARAPRCKRHARILALRHLQGRDDGVHARAVARARRARHLRQYARAGLYPERHRARPTPARRKSRAARGARAARSSATNTRKICSAR